MPHVVSDLYPLIRIELPGVPEPVLVDVVQLVIDDFLRRSEAWRYTIPGLLDWTTAQQFPTITPGTEIPANTRVVRYDVVKYSSDGTNLKTVPFKTRQQLDSAYPDWEVRTGNSPLAWTTNGLFAPIIVPIATADVLGSLKLRVILATDQANTNIPEFILHEFGDAIRLGTLGRIMKIPGKDWTDEQRAATYLMGYEEEVKKAKSRSNAEYGQPDRIMSYGGIGGTTTVGYDDYGQ